MSADNGQPTTLQIPEFAVRQVGALQLQLAAAQEQIQRLSAQLAAVRQELDALKAPRPDAALAD